MTHLSFSRTSILCFSSPCCSSALPTWSWSARPAPRPDRIDSADPFFVTTLANNGTGRGTASPRSSKTGLLACFRQLPLQRRRLPGLDLGGGLSGGHLVARLVQLAQQVFPGDLDPLVVLCEEERPMAPLSQRAGRARMQPWPPQLTSGSRLAGCDLPLRPTCPRKKTTSGLP